MKKIAMSLMTIAAVVALSVGATGAYFSDTETSSGNTFTAGTLDLKVNNQDDPNVSHFSYTDWKPGDSTGYKVMCLKNAGSINGKVSVKFGAVSNAENGVNEPEAIAESNTAIGFVEGELGQYLKRTVGWGPCNWSVPSQVISDWTAGPTHPWGTPGLNGTANQTFTYNQTLTPGQEIGFFVNLGLDNDLQRWDGTRWIDVDDNIIQSDGVLFDMFYKLDQSV